MSVASGSGQAARTATPFPIWDMVSWADALAQEGSARQAARRRATRSPPWSPTPPDFAPARCSRWPGRPSGRPGIDHRRQQGQYRRRRPPSRGPCPPAAGARREVAEIETVHRFRYTTPRHRRRPRLGRELLHRVHPDAGLEPGRTGCGARTPREDGRIKRAKRPANRDLGQLGPRLPRFDPPTEAVDAGTGVFTPRGRAKCQGDSR